MIKKWAISIFLALGFLSACDNKNNLVDVEYMADPCLTPTKDNRFRLCDNMIVRIDDHYHAVPMGFSTDLASIPRIMRPVFSPTDYDTISPAILHDWHYCCEKNIDRRTADNVFYYALKHQGMSSIGAYTYYLGVRLFGKRFYRKGKGLIEHAGEFPKDELQGIFEDVNHYELG